MEASQPQFTSDTQTTGGQPQVQVEPFRFTGSGGEYFRIWIVNLLLTILTLGIYSAWAKVRRLRYFYGNTVLAGTAFEYHGQPIQILKGRLLAFGVFFLVSLAGSIWPIANGLVGLLLLIGMPWIIVKSRTFQARMSSYRNIRFNFNQDYRGAVRVFIGWALLIPLTLGILFPYWKYRTYKFTIGNSRFGTTPFEFLARPGTFYRLFGRAMLLLLGIIIVIGILATIVFAGGFVASRIAQPSAALVLLAIPLTFFVIIGPYLLFAAYLQKSLLNVSIGNAVLGQHRLISRLRTWGLWRVYLVNGLLTLITLGFYWPWAVVNLARYRFECLSLEMRGGLDNFVAEQQADVAAAGQEFGDLFDVDLGL